MPRLSSACFGSVIAAVLIVCVVGTAHAASYLHVALYSDATCNSTMFTYVGITSSPRFANQFLDPTNVPIWSPNGCPTDADPGTILPLYLDNANEIRANVSLNACTAGSVFGYSIGNSYRSVCTNSDDSPFFVAATYQETSYANQTICETTPSIYSRKTVYASQTCSTLGSNSFLYNCINSTHVEVSVCTDSTNCTGCDTSIRDLTRCSGGIGGVATWWDERCVPAPLPPVAAPIAAPKAAPVSAAPATVPVTATVPFVAPSSNTPSVAPKAETPTSSANGLSGAFVLTLVFVASAMC